MKRVLWLNSVGHDQYDQDMLRLFLQEADPDTEVTVQSWAQRPRRLEHNAYGAPVLPGCLRQLRRAEQEGFGAAVMGCFHDPGLKAIRELVTALPVVFPQETCVSLAATMGDPFSILVGRRKCIPGFQRCRKTPNAMGRAVASPRSSHLIWASWNFSRTIK